MDPEKKKEIEQAAEELKQLKKDHQDISVKISNTYCRLNALKENAYTPAEMLLAEARAKAHFYEECFGFLKKDLRECGNSHDNWVGWDGQPEAYRQNEIRKQLEKMEAKE